MSAAVVEAVTSRLCGAPVSVAAASITERLVQSLSWAELAELHESLAGNLEARALLERLADDRDAAEHWAVWDAQMCALGGSCGEDSVAPLGLPCPMKAWASQQFAEYEALQYDRAMVATNGQFLNARGRAAGIDSRRLFRGPVAVVLAYASDELCGFFGQNGRLGFRAFRYTLFRWPSDRAAYEFAMTQDFGHVAHIDQPTC